jgi:hypothetical protein
LACVPFAGPTKSFTNSLLAASNVEMSTFRQHGLRHDHRRF